MFGRSALTPLLLAALVVVGCSSQPERFPTRHRRPVELASATNGQVVYEATTQRTDLITLSKFSVFATPPTGWSRKTNASDPRAEHIVWTSPTGNTAFGVIFFKLPFPIGHELAFRFGVMPEARRREGSAEVLEKYWDHEIEGMRFTVRTPRFTVETKFFVRGMRGWASYAGTKTTQPVDEAELAQARQAREDAEFGEEIRPK